MPDITMCPGTNCPKRESCYRFKATPSPYQQSFFVEAPVATDAEGLPVCEYYWPLDPPAPKRLGKESK